MDDHDTSEPKLIFESQTPKRQLIEYYDKLTEDNDVYVLFSSDYDPESDQTKPSILIEPDEASRPESDVMGVCRVFWHTNEALAYTQAIRKLGGPSNSNVKAYPIKVNDLVRVLSRLNKKIYLQTGKCIRAYTYTTVDKEVKRMEIFWLGEPELYN